MSLLRRGGGAEKQPLLSMPPRSPETISYDEMRPEELTRLTRERFSYVTQWIYGIAVFSALLAAGVVTSICLSVYVLNLPPPNVTTTTTTTTTTTLEATTTPVTTTQPPLTCSDLDGCPLNCSSVAGCLPPPSVLVCNDVQGCINGGNLTLDRLTVQHLTVQNVSQIDVSYQSVFEVQDMILNGSLACIGNMTIGDDCVPLRIKTINVIAPHPVTKNFVIGGGPGIGVSATPNGLDLFNTGVLHVGLSAPVDEFNVTVGVVMSIGTLTFVKNAQLPRTFWAGPASNLSGAQVPQFRPLSEEDFPLLSLMDKVYGILSIALGGTGSNATLIGGRIMVSTASPQAIVEGPILGNLGEFLIGDGAGGVIPAQLVGGYDLNVTVYPNGTIVLSALQSVHSVDLAVPTDLFVVTSPVVTDAGTLSFAVVPQSGNSFWGSPPNGSSGVPAFRALVEADVPVLSLQTKVYGVLPVANGGTNNTGPLTGNRLMMSEAGGLRIVEAPALGNGQVFIGQNGGGPSVAATPTGAGGITIGTGPGTMSVTMTATPSFTTLNVNGATTLGTSTTCAAALAGGCVDISTKTCPGGPVGVNCIPTSGLYFDELTVGVLNIVNFTTQSTIQVINNTNLSTDNLYVENIYVVNNGSLVCSGTGSVAQNCIDISNLACPLGPLQSSCTPVNLTTSDLQSTGTATFNNVVCLGGAIGDNCVTIDSKTCTLPVNDTCVSLHVKTVNGVAPNAITRDLTLLAGTGIGVAGTTITNTVASTPQAGNLFYASPNGTAGLPSFRAIVVSDLPGLGPDEVFFASVGPSNLTLLVAARAVTSVDATVPSGLLAVSGVPFGPGGGTIALSLQSQGPNTVFASPVNATGIPGFRNLTLSDIPPVITTVGLTVPADVLSVTNSPLLAATGGGTLAISKVDQSDNTFWGSPLDGSLGQPTFRKHVFKDFNNLNLTDGQLLGGTTGGDAVPTDILAGSGIVLTKLAGSVTISASLNASNIGTVTNVCITAPGTLFTFSPPCINTSGTFAFVPLVQQAHKFFAAPDAVNGFPGMRYITLGDLPHLYANQMYLGDPVSGNTSITNLTAGNAISIVTAGGTTTIASTFSVGLDLPTSVFNTTIPLVTNTGTLTTVFKTQTAKTFFAGPTSGGAAVPAFRPIGLPDLPALGDGQLYIGNGGTPVATTLSAGTAVTITPGMGSLTVSVNTAALPNMAEAMGEIAVFNTVASTTTILAVSNGVTNMVEVTPATTLASSGIMSFDMPSGGRLRYTGSGTVFCHTATTVTVASAGSNQQYVLGMAINGVIQTRTKIMQKTQGSGDTQSTAMHGYLRLSTNDYISLYVGNMISTNAFQVFSENMFSMCMSVM